MLFEIKHRITNAVLFSLECGSIKLCVEAAICAKADLRYADLRYADLYSANLRYADLRYADLRYANLRYADLRYADLRYADLYSANLRYADLRYANGIDDKFPLPSGETFGQYKSEVLPILLAAGGKTIEQVCAGWDCHEWNNCPMAIAFDFDGDYSKASALVQAWRPRIEQFVQLFDSKLLPNPLGEVATTCSKEDQC